ncbi:MAG: STAS domain-containing protein [Burkholderiaceae bacterium]|jgi:anti-anti-sigma regulatory factor|nr:STAS domain-containing protein [Burkholderiaceae bacterium]
MLLSAATSDTARDCVVFSFFKKDGKDSGRSGTGTSSSRPGARPLSKPVVKPLSKPLPDPSERANARGFPPAKFATTENAIPARDLARSLAMETAAKIDAIESEMARDFLRPAANTGSPAMGPTTGGPKGAKPAAEPAAPPAAAPDVLDPGSDSFLGNINAIDVNTSGAGSIIDETAILFANGQDEAAEATMRHGIDTDTVGENRQTAWKMLFELVNQRGDAAGFEQLTMQYALRFENSSPAWMDYDKAAPMAAPPAPVAAATGPLVKLPEVVDAQIVKALEHLKALAAQHAALTLDVSAARSIDLVGAELLLRVVNAFKRSNHELTVLGPEQLLAPLHAAVESGRRDASDAGWMLLLEVLRLLGRQPDFEETGIQYCITFEVSPPSWEPAPPSLKARSAAPSSAPAAPAEAVVDAFDPLDWRGVIEREGEPYFGRLAVEARSNDQLKVECQYLRRMAFSTATTLLTLLMKLQAAGVRVEFVNVNPLVAALLHLLGITAIASVQTRRS